MKTNRVLYPLIFLGMVLPTLAACGGNTGNGPIEENKGQKVSEKANYYHNNSYNDYVSNGDSSLLNQWDNYGFSSPFIMRYNGYYYLYSSTSNNDALNGVRAWKSRDLVNWESVTAPGLSTGYVVSSNCGESAKARAPEVYYYNGHFYMYESYNAGDGHFVLKSNSPEGPFTALSKAVVDNKKDGTVIFGKNENPFFLTADKGHINISTMQGMEAIIDTSLAVSGTEVDSKMYAESPAVFSHLGKYYLLYSTGYDTLDGYHINYATSDGWDNETPSDVASSFKAEKHNLLLNTNKKEGFVGLGHPSVVIGPDLDSHYLVYDCLNSGLYNNHSLNIDRLLVDGDLLTVKHNRYNSVAPQMPVFISDNQEGFKEIDGYLLSENKTEDAFSIEYNFVSAQNSELVFSYTDKNNYSYIKVDMSNSIKLYQKVGGADQLIKEVGFYNYFLNTDLHTIRLGYKDGKLDLYFENSLKMSNLSISLKGGKVGYLKSEELGIRYTCFSNVAGGLSDEQEYKQATGEIPATLYDRKSSNVTTLIEENNADSYGKYAHIALKHNEYARYKVNFNKSATYGLELNVSKDMMGRKLIVEVDDEKNITLEVPANMVEGDYIKVLVGNININSGLHNIKIQAVNHELEFVSFTFKEIASEGYTLSSKLENENELDGLTFASDCRWNFINNKMVSLANYRNIALSEEQNLHNFDLSVNMALTGSDSIFSETSETGIVFRCNEYVSYQNYMDSHSDVKMWNNRYYQLSGYYLAFTNRKVTLYKFASSETDVTTIQSIQYSLGNKKEKNIILKVRDSRFDLFVDGKVVTTFYDAFGYTTGAVGLYTTGAEVSYSNLKIVGK